MTLLKKIKFRCNKNIRTSLKTLFLKDSSPALASLICKSRFSKIEKEPMAFLEVPIIIFFLFFLGLFCPTKILAQPVDPSREIKISTKSCTVDHLLSELINVYSINFSYNDKDLPLDKTMEFEQTMLALNDILEKLQEEAEISFHIFNDVIILKSQKATKKFIISGYVEDATSGEKLIGANVYNGLHHTGTISNAYGFYSLPVTQGYLKLVASYVGYKPYEQLVDLNSDTTILIALSPMLEIEEVKIEGQRREHNTISKLSAMKVSSKEIKKIPPLFGEVDVLKSLQLLPGVQTGMEGSSGLVVRGGGTDQNLIVLDGVPVYNVNHLFGFFSVFNPSAIKDVTLYKSGFPARYGGRTSSVIDITMKEGNNKEMKGEGAIGLISSKFTLEGPIKNEKTSFIISGRRTYFDIIAKPLLTKKEKNQTTVNGYYFYDLNMKINHRFSHKSRLFLSSYLGSDVFHTKVSEKQGLDRLDTDNVLKWGNITTNLRWNYIFGNKLFSNTTLSYSTYRFSISEERDLREYIDDEKKISTYRGKFMNGIYDLSAKVDFDYFPNQHHLIKFGAGYTNHTFVPSSFIEKKTPGNDTSIVNKIDGHEAFFYVEDDLSFIKRLNLNVGLHNSFFTSKKKNYFHVQPRISAKYAPWPDFSCKASYSNMVQYLQTNSYSSISLPLDLWVPSTDSIKPVRSDNYSMGFEYQPTNKFTIGTEGFYKTMKNVVAFKEGSFPNPGFLNDIVQGIGWAYGVEFVVKKNTGKTTGWLSYTWSRSWRKFNGISYNEKFPYKYDRRHDISLVVMHKFNNRIDMAGSWVYATGNAMSLSTEKYISNFALEAYSPEEVSRRPHIQVFEHRNNYRTPSYHRMDMGINFHKQKKRYTRTWSFGAYNVYSKNNPIWIHWDDSEQFADKQGLYQLTLFQLIPYFTYSFKF